MGLSQLLFNRYSYSEHLGLKLADNTVHEINFYITDKLNKDASLLKRAITKPT